jgi:hypothetical protein
MAGLVPAIHVLLLAKKDVDARHEAGHDESLLDVPFEFRSSLALESAAAAADDGAHRFIGAEIFGAIDIEQG